MRKFLITAASAACMVAVVAMAPSALAANESAQLSSLDSGASFSGSYSSTVASDVTLNVSMDIRSSLFSVSSNLAWSTVSCAAYGISVTINTTPASVTCGTQNSGGMRYVTAELGYITLQANDAITLTWGPGLVTSTGSLNGPYVEVRVAGSNSFATVTPTGPFSSSAGDAASVLMWQQAYGRASATDSCQDGYTPSWDTWPNGGTGGFVCNRFVPEYGN